MAAVLVGHADGLSYDDALRRIRSLRAVEPEKVFERQGGEATSIALRIASLALLRVLPTP